MHYCKLLLPSDTLDTFWTKYYMYVLEYSLLKPCFLLFLCIYSFDKGVKRSAVYNLAKCLLHDFLEEFSAQMRNCCLNILFLYLYN